MLQSASTKWGLWMKKANKNLPDGLMSNKFVGDEAWVARRVITWYAKSLSPWGDET